MNNSSYDSFPEERKQFVELTLIKSVRRTKLTAFFTIIQLGRAMPKGEEEAFLNLKQSIKEGFITVTKFKDLFPQCQKLERMIDKYIENKDDRCLCRDYFWQYLYPYLHQELEEIQLQREMDSQNTKNLQKELELNSEKKYSMIRFCLYMIFGICSCEWFNLNPANFTGSIVAEGVFLAGLMYIQSNVNASNCTNVTKF